jgi:arginine exporter protein ArgO
VNRLKIAIDVAGIAGAAAVVEGVREISHAAAWIVGGAFLLAFAWFMAKAATIEARP